MYKKFEINWTKIKGDCQSGRKVVPHDSKSDLPLVENYFFKIAIFVEKVTLEAACKEFKRQITLGIVGYHFSSRLTATLNLCLIYFKII